MSVELKMTLAETPLSRKLTLLGASSLTIMTGAMIAPALPAIRDHFSDINNIGTISRLVLTLPSLFIVVLSPLSGILSDKFGRKPLIVLASLIYVLAGLTSYFAPSMTVLLLSRAVLGAAAGVVITISTTLIGDYFVGAERGKFMGIQAAWMGMVGILCQVAGGALADINWRSPFLLYLLVIPLIFCAWIFLVEPSKQTISRQEEEFEMASKRPKLLLLYLLTLLGSAAFFLVPTQLPFHLETLGIEEGLLTGFAIATMTLGGVVASFFYQRVRDQANNRMVTALAYIGMAIGYIIVFYVKSYAGILIAMVIAGMGKGLLVPHMQLLVVQIAPAALRGKLVGGLMASFYLGQFVSPLITQPISSAFGLTATFLVIGLILLVTISVYLTLSRPKTIVATGKT